MFFGHLSEPVECSGFSLTVRQLWQEGRHCLGSVKGLVWSSFRHLGHLGFRSHLESPVRCVDILHTLQRLIGICWSIFLNLFDRKPLVRYVSSFKLAFANFSSLKISFRHLGGVFVLWYKNETSCIPFIVIMISETSSTFLW